MPVSGIALLKILENLALVVLGLKTTLMGFVCRSVPNPISPQNKMATHSVNYATSPNSSSQISREQVVNVLSSTLSLLSQLNVFHATILVSHVLDLRKIIVRSVRVRV